MDEEKYSTAFEIIANAGTAKGCALEAIDASSDGDFEEADRLLAEGREEMHACHDAQFGMLQQEASGKPVELNVILVHSLDHLTMAIMTLDLAEKIIDRDKRRAGVMTDAAS